MCGIAGFVTPQRPADEMRLRQMTDVIAHRGPDDDGYFVRGGVALGMRRLSIIGIASGKQPISNEDGSVTVVFNGEIYNFRELRAELQGRGHTFATETDTECIVHLYEELGERCVDKLRGMFAFAVWDARREQLVLARDRAGKKPLFYRETGDGLLFGSELKSLLQDPATSRNVDPVALHHYLTLQYVPAPFAILQGVQKLPPAHTLTFRHGQVRVERYWRLRYEPKLPVSEDEAAERVRDAIREATRIRMFSERPLGAFLSGGIDSSIVVAAMAEASPNPVKTFTIGFEAREYDERRYARVVADRFGTDHHEFVVGGSALDVLPTLAWYYDEPFADSSAIPTFYVSQVTRRHVTVALNGDGGDESFAGYDRYVVNVAAARLRTPSMLRPPVGRLAQRLMRGDAKTFARKAGRALDMLAQDSTDRYARLMSYFTREQKAALYTPEMAARVSGVDTYDLLRHVSETSDARHLVDRTLQVDVETYLPGDLLVKVDIASMANSLEARSPLLDHKVMELAAALPREYKLRGRHGKWVLKKLARGWLPDEVLDRPKRGFGVPLAAWLRTELRDLSWDLLTDATAQSRGYFRPDAVRTLLTEHSSGVDHSTRLWALLMFEMWHRTWLDGAAPEQPPLHESVARG